VEFTPPGSEASIHIGKGITSAAPGSLQNLYLIVSDIEKARADLLGCFRRPPEHLKRRGMTRGDTIAVQNVQDS
jgi:hypothetical protein